MLFPCLCLLFCAFCFRSCFVLFVNFVLLHFPCLIWESQVMFTLPFQVTTIQFIYLFLFSSSLFELIHDYIGWCFRKGF
eukprot:m.23181 g.23181  ORF g.23181 m.23181 type:complete len:79 (-) comp9448_c0_seq1:939-1175(-)